MTIEGAGQTGTQDLHSLPLLLEIGTEEIPARFLPRAVEELKNVAEDVFREYRIDRGEIQTFATPRRLVLMMTGIPMKQRDVTREVFGPAKKAAFDQQGNPTKAAAGFASSLGISVADLTIKLKGKGEYVAAILEDKGKETKEVLGEAVKKIILSLHFPKAMRWGSGSLSFVRPIHWIVALFGTETLDFEIDGIRSGNMTRGHRFLSPASFQIREMSSYMSMLENNFVVLDQEKRKNLITKGITNLAESVNGRPLLDEELLETVTYLVEFPVPVLCSFSEEYLELPKELLITVMKDHQKYFAIQNGRGDLINKFVVISNTRVENSETVRVGAQRVIKARFDDAKFYFREDRRQTLHSRVESLKQVTFHDELGSLFEKTNRLSAIVSFLAENITPPLKNSRAALLSKTDLITGVVREFPELQGIMGKYYAGHDGEEPAVCDALEEQYMPKFFGGKLPETQSGALLSLADKIDNITAFFSIDMVPSGSEDPFALRRQAMGIVSILLQRGFMISLREIFEKALQNLPVIKSKGNVLEKILGFMEQRVEFVLSSSGYDHEMTRAVLPLSSVSPLKAVAGRIDALSKFREESVFSDFLLAIKRVSNILPKTPLPPVREDILLQDEEKALHSCLQDLRERISPLVAEERFLDALLVLSGITPPVNAFFDKVLVMDKREEVKTNRLSLLHEIWKMALPLADFSKIG
jgi:glycyl-tRNA synthetase beta chain